MRIQSLTELSNTIKERIEFFMLTTQDMLVEELSLDESNFSVSGNILNYADIYEIRYNPVEQIFSIYGNGNTRLSREVTLTELANVFNSWLNLLEE